MLKKLSIHNLFILFAVGVFLFSLIIFPLTLSAAPVPVGGSSARPAPCPPFSTPPHIYCTLAPIGEFVPANFIIKEGGLGGYLNGIVKILVALAGALAVIMIIYGGIQYMLTDSVYGKDAGKKTITNALEGLLLALTAFIILNTINPALLSTQLNSLKPITNLTRVEGGGGIGSGVSAIPNIDQNTTFAGQRVLSPGDVGYPYSPEDPRYGSVYPVGGNSGPISAITAETNDGIVVNTSNIRLDTDGRNPPPFEDRTRSANTSYRPGGQSLDANTDYYVVAPLNAQGRTDIPMGTRVTVRDYTSGRQIEAVVGDAGPSANGYGELSLAALRALGATTGTSDSASSHRMSLTFHTN